MRSISLIAVYFQMPFLMVFTRGYLIRVDLGEAPDVGEAVSTVFEGIEGAEETQPGANETGQEQPADS